MRSSVFLNCLLKSGSKGGESGPAVKGHSGYKLHTVSGCATVHQYRTRRLYFLYFNIKKI